MEEVKLLGFWPSHFVYRVIWALKLKGVKFDYIEEDISNKSELLLQYNPVFKKVPVLVHGGKPIAESLVILEYIEETWPQNPLLPKDPYEKALARFWIQFGMDKFCFSMCWGGEPSIPYACGRSRAHLIRPYFRPYMSAVGQEHEKAAKELQAVLKILEGQCLRDQKFFGGETINLVDISYGMLGCWMEYIEEAVGVKVIEPSSLPRLHAWAQNFKLVPVIKDNFPDHGKLLAYYKTSREKMVSARSTSQ